MDAGEVVVHVVERHRRRMVVELLREGVRQPRKPANRHAHREILALDVGRADVRRVRLFQDIAASGSGSLCIK